MAEKRVRGVYGGPFAKMVDSRGEFILNKRLLERLGQCIVDHVVIEAKKDFAKQGKSARGQPEGLPDSTGQTIRPSFFDSFGYKIVGEKTIEVTSSWPWIDGLVEGRPAGPMTGLVREKIAKPIPIIKDGGKVIFRMTPFSNEKLWVHPGIARHTFLERGVKKARDEMAKIVTQEIKERLVEERAQ
jgi:hypothetical protein